MKSEIIRFGWHQWTTSNGYVVVAEATDRKERNKRVTLTDPSGLNVLSFEHTNPVGAAHELAVVIDRSAHEEVPAS
jgi:hypothetical protein